MPTPPKPLSPGKSGRHFFGAEVRRLRELAGMSQAALGTIVNISASQVGRLEAADAPIPHQLAASLDAAFDTDGHFDRLHELARHERHPDRYRKRMEAEAEAVRIEEYSGQLIPGIIQNEPYAGALFRASQPDATQGQLDELVAARLERQLLLRVTKPPHLTLLLDEAVLQRHIGGFDVMRSQLGHLLQVTDETGAIVQIVPFSSGAHGLLGGTLTLLTMPDGRLLAYEECIDTGTLIDDPGEASRRQRLYDYARADALPRRESAQLIREVMESP